MAYQKFTGTYQSSDHINRIHYYIYEPETDLRAILQIVHDFGDFVERNENLIRFFTDHGVMVCGCDHIGHGRSSKKEDYEKRISRYTVFYLWTWTGISHCANGLYP